MEKQTSQTNPTASYRNPAWWSEKHTSGWDRVKEAFRRDWEQTKADFSSSSGEELNQDVGDTLKQAVGAEPIPPSGVKNPVDPKDAVKAAGKAREDMVEAAEDANKAAAKASEAITEKRAKLSEKVAEVRKDAAKAEFKASEKIAEAQQSAVDDIQKEREKVTEAAAKRDEATAKWRQAEQEARYGYAVRMQRPTEEWNDALEGTLRGEWSMLGTGRSWEESRMGIRRGWDHAGMKH